MNDEELKNLCAPASVWAGHILSDEFDPENLGDEHPQNIKNCYRLLARAFVGLLARNPEMKPTFRVRQQS